MNEKQEVQLQEVDADQLRELTNEEILGVAGGPQVQNDGNPP